MSSKDISMNQDIRVLSQQVIKEFMSVNPHGGVIINNFTVQELNVNAQTIPVDNTPTIDMRMSNLPQPTVPRRELRLTNVPEEIDDQINNLLDSLPNPRMDYLIYHVFRVAANRFKSQLRISEFFGISRDAVSSRMTKFGLKATGEE